MRKNLHGSAFVALLSALVCLTPLQALAGESAIKALGTGSSVTCDTTPNAGSDADDTSIANTQDRVLACVNTGSTTVYIGGTSVAGAGTPLAPAGRVSMRLAADVVPKCYAASSTTIACTEYVGSGDVTGAPIPGGGRFASLSTIAAFTTLSSSWQVVATSDTIPAWANSVHAQCVITALNNTGAAAANFYGALVPMVDGTTTSLSGAGGPLGGSGTIATPNVGSLVELSINPDLPNVQSVITNLAYSNLSWLPRGKVRLYIRTETAPGTSWSVACEWFARG